MIAVTNSEIVHDPFHGVLLVDKPVGLTSHDVVGRARRILGTRSVGHAGTLDPIASGLLILLVGEATKLSNFLLNGDKGYEVKIRLGVETDTLDISGHILTEKAVDVTLEQIQSAVQKVTGPIQLAVPKFSAVKVDGKTLYKEARQGNDVETPIREMNFYDVCITGFESPFLNVRLKCSKGSYIRSWAHELGKLLGSGACVQNLNRFWSEPYELTRACTLDQLQKQPWQSLRAAIPLAQSLENWPAVMVDGKDQTLLKNGQLSHGMKGRLRVYYRNPQTSEVVRGIKVLGRSAAGQKQLLAILEASHVEGDFRIARIINNVT